ncbi:MAG: hypothetical protein Q9200_005011 [Gallowayella weberi]
MRFALALLLALGSSITNAIAGGGHGALAGLSDGRAVENYERPKDRKAHVANPLPNENGINPEGENPMGTAPCGTYATTATDGPCGAWLTAMYSITPIESTTTFTTIKTMTVVLKPKPTE